MPKIKKIDHIGIVVPTIEQGVQTFKRILLKEPSHKEYIDAYKVDLAFFDIGDIQVELLAPTAPDSEMAPFLEKTGGGFHHICYEVEGIDQILEGLKKQGVKLMDEKPRPGSRNSRIAFVEAGSAGGVYTEYCEFPH
jgi:methylmalonyl-CoA/ethylmalonyl-CoA epimerase